MGDGAVANTSATAKMFDFMYCHRRDRSRRAEQNPQQRESTTQKNDEPERLCCGAMHVTCFLAHLGIHAVNCVNQSPSATGTGFENPRAGIVDLLFSITIARVSTGFNGRAHARTSHARAPQISATVALQIVHWAIEIATSS